MPLLLALAPEGTIPRTGEIHIDGPVLAFTFGVSLLTGILFGLVPACHLLRRPLRDSLEYANHPRAGRASQHVAGLGGGTRTRAAGRAPV